MHRYSMFQQPKKSPQIKNLTYRQLRGGLTPMEREKRVMKIIGQGLLQLPKNSM
jgi:hypothetical protein